MIATTADTDQGQEIGEIETTDATEARTGEGMNRGVTRGIARGIESMMIAEEDEAHGTLVMIGREALADRVVRPQFRD